MSNADLRRANLEQAKLTKAQLAGCNLFRSRGADLSEAECDITTIGPEGY
ncbi:MAG: pentapeptide repeat-containing protein [Microcoleus sp.]